MDTLRSETLAPFVDLVASPPVVLLLALLLFFAARESRWPWTLSGGAILWTLTAGGLALGLANEPSRRLILHPDRLPIVVAVMATFTVLWWEMRRVRGLANPPDLTRHSEPADAIDPADERSRDPDLIAATVTLLLIISAAALIPAPLGAPATGWLEAVSLETASSEARAPWFLIGWQEVRATFDPWWSHLALPLLCFGGLLMLPRLRTTGISGPARRRALFLFIALFLGLLPIVLGGFFRSSSPAAATPSQTVSEALWVGVLHMLEPASWWLRELPGFLLLFCYLVLLPLQLTRWSITRGVFLRYRDAMGTWRFYVAVVWVLALTLVPVKIYAHWLFDIRYWINLPELGFRF